jgi:predicted phosphodiesterase
LVTRAYCKTLRRKQARSRVSGGRDVNSVEKSGEEFDMNHSKLNIALTRRDALQRLSAGTLLALGLWPGALRANNERPSGSFRFLVINDTHSTSPECGPYLEGVVKQMQKEDAEFCLHAGDLTDKGERSYFEMVKEIFSPLPGAFHPVIGNHDYVSQTDRESYTLTFPRRLNYHFGQGGWQFIALDTSDGQRYEKTSIQPATFQWMDEQLPRLSKTKPTVIFTHFPLGAGVKYRPENADALLERFREFNLQAVFSGHYHAFTECQAGKALFTTNRCCSLKRGNHDGSKEKGYFLCSAQDGRILRSFVEYKPA